MVVSLKLTMCLMCNLMLDLLPFPLIHLSLPLSLTSKLQAAVKITQSVCVHVCVSCLHVFDNNPNMTPVNHINWSQCKHFLQEIFETATQNEMMP